MKIPANEDLGVEPADNDIVVKTRNVFHSLTSFLNPPRFQASLSAPRAPSKTLMMRSLYYYRPILALVVLLATPFKLALAENATKCYAPNGEEAKYSDSGSNLVLYACPAGSDGFATCCVGTDFCHPDNLCYNLNDGAPTVFRQYCTDPTWQSDNCSPLCRTGGEENASTTGAVGLSPCSDGKFCCGWFNNDCCDNHLGNYAIQGTQVGPGTTFTASTSSAQYTNKASISSSSVLPTTSSAIEASSSADSDSASKSTSLDTGAIAGIGVGAAGVLGIFALASVLLWRRRRSSSAPPASQDPQLPSNHPDSIPPAWSARQSWYPPQQFADTTKPNDVYSHEVGIQRRPTPEMSDVPVRHELHAQ